ncbi:Ger(x)C family spore germination protein [Peribacillus huizhouensis]|uniref:Spore germination protein KC n=1 Tax=Peribacillus huizhouensis TaxID=1501239 RepID=A0ABR6CLV6_9BACI|nr:Ger(x)C family spore germination protein [Peribacillus huizhouensis]MBA9026000.1 spore germination protein KC [Peribacillus huizhouensis]
MNRRLICFVIYSSLLFTSGCWDRVEINNRAIWIATGLDAIEKEGIQLTGQILIPSSMNPQNGGGGNGEKNFFLISAIGKNITDATQKIQMKLSRKAFYGQRRVLLLGEEFAKLGLKNQLDFTIKDPNASLRTDAFVVKKGTAIDMLNLSYPLENIPAEAPLKEHSQAGGMSDTSYLHFLKAVNSKGIRPSLPAIEIGNFQDGEGVGKKGEKSYQLTGSAVFDQDLKLCGYLNMEEYRDQLWIMEVLKKRSLTILIEDGNVSLDLDKMGSKVIPEISRNKNIKFTIVLTGEGAVIENNTNLDLTQPKNLEFMQNEFNKQYKKQVAHTITKVQTEYGTDIFGFGEVIHKQIPYQWRDLMNDWDKKFSDADVTVKVNLTIRRVGMSGPSLRK